MTGYFSRDDGGVTDTQEKSSADANSLTDNKTVPIEGEVKLSYKIHSAPIHSVHEALLIFDLPKFSHVTPLGSATTC